MTTTQIINGPLEGGLATIAQDSLESKNTISPKPQGRKSSFPRNEARYRLENKIMVAPHQLREVRNNLKELFEDVQIRPKNGVLSPKNTILNPKKCFSSISANTHHFYKTQNFKILNSVPSLVDEIKISDRPVTKQNNNT
jgi:hypothetical protein